MGMGSKSCTDDTDEGIVVSRSNSEDKRRRERSSLVESQYGGRNRLSLVGTAILERENLPLLTATYHYWTDQASDFFHEQVNDFKSIELNKVAFGVNGFTEENGRNLRKGINDGSIYKSASMEICRQKANRVSSHSDYMWTLKSKEELQTRKFSMSCNSFLLGFLTCMLICTGYYYLLLL